MSCSHGNHPDACDICDEIDAAYNRGQVAMDALREQNRLLRDLIGSWLYRHWESDLAEQTRKVLGEMK